MTREYRDGISATISGVFAEIVFSLLLGLLGGTACLLALVFLG
jgi:hypothetical protein